MLVKGRKKYFNTMRDLHYQSHMFKHSILAHEGVYPPEIDFGMRGTASFKSAMKRQIAEAVEIESEM